MCVISRLIFVEASKSDNAMLDQEQITKLRFYHSIRYIILREDAVSIFIATSIKVIILRKFIGDGLQIDLKITSII